MGGWNGEGLAAAAVNKLVILTIIMTLEQALSLSTAIAARLE